MNCIDDVVGGILCRDQEDDVNNRGYLHVIFLYLVKVSLAW